MFFCFVWKMFVVSYFGTIFLLRMAFWFEDLFPLPNNLAIINSNLEPIIRAVSDCRLINKIFHDSTNWLYHSFKAGKNTRWNRKRHSRRSLKYCSYLQWSFHLAETVSLGINLTRVATKFCNYLISVFTIRNVGLSISSFPVRFSHLTL